MSLTHMEFENVFNQVLEGWSRLGMWMPSYYQRAVQAKRLTPYFCARRKISLI